VPRAGLGEFLRAGGGVDRADDVRSEHLRARRALTDEQGVETQTDDCGLRCTVGMTGAICGGNFGGVGTIGPSMTSLPVRGGSCLLE
jgi:hypothetical protein